jgi:hypothetical protein
VIDKWMDQGPSTYRATLPLDGGPHDVVMEYYENGGGATAKLEYERVDPAVVPGETPPDLGPTTPYLAEFWNTPDATGPPTIPTTTPDLTRYDETLAFDWGESSPGSPVNSNLFVARWTKTVKLSAGLYRLSGVRDDGIRVYIDGIPVIDEWTYGRDSFSVEKVVLGGTHVLRVEAFEAGGGAQAEFNYERIGDVPATSGDYTGEYFDNRDLTGPPVLTRTDDAIDFNWGAGAPAGLPANNFSARWTKTFTVDEESSYKFTVTGDDGVRLYIDGQKVIDRWTFQNGATSTVSYTLPVGAHQIVLEYFEAAGDALVKFTYQPTAEPAPPLTSPGEPYAAEYFTNRDLSGDPVLTRDDAAIDFDWGNDGPGGGVPTDNFSARWTKALSVASASSYKFTVTADDGVRLFIDGQMVLDKWAWSATSVYTVNQYLEPGIHQIVLEYFEANGSAVAKLAVEQTAEGPPPPPPPPAEQFTAEYFDNQNLDGTPVLTRTDDAIDFDWGAGSPNFVIPFNQFSARWTRTTSYEAGTYRFSVTGDDGIRVLVDGVPVINGWFYQAATTYTVDVPLTEGEHTVVVEYFEFSGGAVAKYSETKVA